MRNIKRTLLDPANLSLISFALVLGAATGIFPLWRHTIYAFAPAVVVSLFSLVVSYRRLTAQRRQARRADGFCVSCGYDLGAGPGRCPECGTASDHPDAKGISA